MGSATRTTTAAVTALAAMTLLPAGARGAETYQGQRATLDAISCASIISPPQRTVESVWTWARFHANDDSPVPRVGEVFFVGGAVANVGDPCGGIGFLPHVLLPDGVESAVTAERPAVARFETQSAVTNWEPMVVAPSVYGAGGFSMAVRNRDTGAPQTLQLATGSGAVLVFRFPVRATRPLEVGASQLCPARPANDPCRGAELRDAFGFVAETSVGTVAAYVNGPVAPDLAAQTTPPVSGSPQGRLRGRALTITPRRPGPATLVVTIGPKAGGAKRTVRPRLARGAATVTVRLTAAEAALARRGRLRVTVRAASQPASAARPVAITVS